jgi:prepilin-type N-terminal cleavage/methylation domain-containing protein
VTRARRWRRGFTLAETLVAIAVLSALVGSVFGFMGGLAQRRDTLERLTEDTAAGDSLFRNLEADIVSCVAGAPGAGAGIAGDAQSLRLLSRSGLIDPAGEGIELVRGEYRFDAAGRSVTVARRGARGGAGGGSEVISRRVQLLRFRYLSQGRWRERFDSAEAGGLPVAIELAVWFGEAASAAPAGAEAGAGSDEAMAEAPLFDDLEDRPAAYGEPDRVRMFIVADGPTGGWEGAR